MVISRDHHDVSGTDSPFRETSNVYDGSAFCAGEVKRCVVRAVTGRSAMLADPILAQPSVCVYVLVLAPVSLHNRSE